MEWTHEELRVLNETDCRDAITSVLQKSMIKGGRIALANMDAAEIDYAIHLLRSYRAMTIGPTMVEILTAAS